MELIKQTLLVQCLALGATFLLCSLFINLSLLTRIVIVSTYITAPLGVVIKGAASFIYVHDILVIPLSFILLIRGLKIIRQSEFKCILFIMYFLWPLIVFGVNYSFFSSYEQREILDFIVWLYRNLIIIIYFYFGFFITTTDEIQNIVKQHLCFIFVVCCLGFVNYFGSQSYDVYDLVVEQQYADSDAIGRILTERIGFGFFGLFRGSIGVIFCLTSLISMFCVLNLNPRWRTLSILCLAFSLLLILFSYSRAGMIGVVVGISWYSLISKRKSFHFLYLFAILTLLVVAIVAIDESVGQRMLSIIDYKDDIAAEGRLAAWERIVDYIFSNPYSILYGFGFGNSDQLIHIVGGSTAHNAYLESFLRLGILGPCFILFLIAKQLIAFYNFNYSTLFVVDLGRFGAAMVIAMSAVGLTQDFVYYSFSGFTAGVYTFLLMGTVVSCAHIFQTGTSTCATMRT